MHAALTKLLHLPPEVAARLRRAEAGFTVASISMT